MCVSILINTSSHNKNWEVHKILILVLFEWNKIFQALLYHSKYSSQYGCLHMFPLSFLWIYALCSVDTLSRMRSCSVFLNWLWMLIYLVTVEMSKSAMFENLHLSVLWHWETTSKCFQFKFLRSVLVLIKD